MPIGDIGGFASQLILTCVAGCDISKGDPVTHLHNYTVKNYLGDLFGQAMEDAKEGQTLPVRVRGVCRFDSDKFKVYDSTHPGCRWRISENGPVLVPMVMGNVLEVLYLSEERLDILL